MENGNNSKTLSKEKPRKGKPKPDDTAIEKRKNVLQDKETQQRKGKVLQVSNEKKLIKRSIKPSKQKKVSEHRKTKKPEAVKTEEDRKVKADKTPLLLKGEVGLGLMPIEIITHITEFLPYRDIINLSMTCQYMKNIMPSFRQIKARMKNSNENWKTSKAHGTYHGLRIPLLHFDTPRITSPYLSTLRISMKWRVSSIFYPAFRVGFPEVLGIQLIRPTSDNFIESEPRIVIEDQNTFRNRCIKKIKERYDYEENTVKILNLKNDVVRKFQAQDYFRFVMASTAVRIEDLIVVMQFSSSQI